ncbi:MAG: magnesium transporter, partial [Coriobacteriia bacterium]|nr:magnesium transporter [Coriobacteriia bacterium]
MNTLTDAILTYLESRNIAALNDLVEEAEVHEILAVLDELSSEEQAIVYRLLSKEKALDVFEQLDTSSQQKLLKSFTDEKAIEMMDELPPDDRVRLLDELPAMVAKRLIASLSPEERVATNIIMGYGQETAGREMT